MDLGNGLGHLTYSTLVHPGDDWEQMWASLNTYVPKVKARMRKRASRNIGSATRRSTVTKAIIEVIDTGAPAVIPGRPWMSIAVSDRRTRMLVLLK